MISSKNSAIVVPIILSGGVGARLWPLSKKDNPKQFIKINNKLNLIQETFLRALSIGDIKEIVTVTNKTLFDKTKSSYDEIAHGNVHTSFILEPFGRNSAPAVSIAAHYIFEKYGEDAILLVLPADHLINNKKEFKNIINNGIDLANEGKLVTFAIQPDRLDPNFGHIISNGNKVETFVEKPDKKKIKDLLKVGNMFWNSGIFCMRVNTFRDEMSNHSPLLLSVSEKCVDTALFFREKTWSRIDIDSQQFDKVQKISIDCALFEKSDNVFLVEFNTGWSDVGSWNDLGKNFLTDENQNQISSETLIEDVENCTIYSDAGIIVGKGLKNLIVVKVGDELLIINKKYAGDMRQINIDIEKYKNQFF